MLSNKYAQIDMAKEPPSVCFDSLVSSFVNAATHTVATIREQAEIRHNATRMNKKLSFKNLLQALITAADPTNERLQAVLGETMDPHCVYALSRRDITWLT